MKNADTMLWERIVILDFGSQYTQLIARRIRENKVFAEIVPYNTPIDSIDREHLIGIILSGGPATVLGEDSPKIGKEIFALGVPVLGICYGMQLMAYLLGGKLGSSVTREYGRAQFHIKRKSSLLEALPDNSTVWMSHGDSVETVPDGFVVTGETDTLSVASFEEPEKALYGLQFHPEVAHTEFGNIIIENFLVRICYARQDYTPASFVEHTVGRIRNEVGDRKLIMGVSGGVDSTVAAVLIHRAIGRRLVPVFVDNGLLRENEANDVLRMFRSTLSIPVRFVDASDRFLKNLSGVSDPEEKRKVIGHTFIEVFEEVANSIPGICCLGQGTLYPDLIESVSFRGPSATIKSHHNVGGLPEHMRLTLVEPLKELFKDEVRSVGRSLEIPNPVLMRHPFPGPGLAVRIIGEVTKDKLDILRKVDNIFVQALKDEGLYDKVWQAFAVLLPVHSVGVMGDERTYGNAVVLRAVVSQDGMTADWAHLPYDFLAKVSGKIINSVKEVNRVAYDISSKPPSTIEWE